MFGLKIQWCKILDKYQVCLALCGNMQKIRDMESNLGLCLLLAIPFTIVATPWYICYVIFVGCRRVFWPQHEDEDPRDRTSANFKSTEVLLESALQTSLGRLSIFRPIFLLLKVCTSCSSLESTTIPMPQHYNWGEFSFPYSPWSKTLQRDKSRTVSIRK